MAEWLAFGVDARFEVRVRAPSYVGFVRVTRTRVRGKKRPLFSSKIEPKKATVKATKKRVSKLFMQVHRGVYRGVYRSVYRGVCRGVCRGVYRGVYR